MAVRVCVSLNASGAGGGHRRLDASEGGGLRRGAGPNAASTESPTRLAPPQLPPNCGARASMKFKRSLVRKTDAGQADIRTRPELAKLYCLGRVEHRDDAPAAPAIAFDHRSRSSTSSAGPLSVGTHRTLRMGDRRRAGHPMWPPGSLWSGTSVARSLTLCAHALFAARGADDASTHASHFNSESLQSPPVDSAARGLTDPPVRSYGTTTVRQVPSSC